MRVGSKELTEFSNIKTAQRLLNLAFNTLLCKSYTVRSSTKFELVKQIDVDEVIIAINKIILSDKPMDVRNRASREKHLELLIRIRDNIK